MARLSKSIRAILLVIMLLPCAILFASCGKSAEYNINFMVDGQVYETVVSSGKEEIKLPKEPEKSGYEFVGWFFDENEWKEEFTASTYADKALNKDINIYAYFEKAVEVQAVIDGVVVETLRTSESKNYMISALKPADITTDESIGKYFYGWFIDSDFKTALTDKTRFLKNSQIYAKWVEVNVDKFTYVEDNGSATITGYDMGGEIGAIVVVPSVINSIPVKEIGANCFAESKIGEVIICDGVQKIGSKALYKCGHLRKVVMPDSVQEIGDSAMQYSYGSMESIRVSSGVTFIGTSAFPDLGDAKKLVCNEFDNVKYLGNENDKYLILLSATNTEILMAGISNKCKFICEEAFAECEKLNYIAIPNSVVGIDKKAFLGCKGLNEMVLPNNIVEIREQTFSGCTGLTKLVIPSGVTQIGENAFMGCHALAEIYNLSDLALSMGSSNNGLVACCAKVIYSSMSEQSKLSTERNVIYYNDGDEKVALTVVVKSATKVEIVSGCTAINDWAFEDCEAVETVVVANTVKSIGDSAFRFCGALKKVEFGSGSQLSVIKMFAFSNCAKLEYIIIPISVSNMEEEIFAGCSKSLAVYCEAESKPYGWSEYWNYGDTDNVYWYSKTKPESALAKCWFYDEFEGVKYPIIWNNN